MNSGVDEPIGDPYHGMVYCETVLLQLNETLYSRQVWHYNKGNFEALKSELKHIPWHALNFLDVDERAEIWTEHFLNTAKEFIPYRSVKIRPNDKYFITSDIRWLLRKRKRLWKLWNRTKNPDHYTLFSECRKQVKEAIKTSKERFYSNNLEKLNNPECSRKVYWHLLKTFYGNKSKPRIPVLIEGGESISSTKFKCEIFNKHFQEKSKLPSEVNLPKLPDLVESIPFKLDEFETSEEEVKTIIKVLNTSKANGPDNVSNRLLKETVEVISGPLAALFNDSLSKGKFPSCWKRANVSPVYKGKKSRQDKNNYRPISLLSNVGKVLERIVFKHLYKFCSDNNLLTWRNSGYKPGDSTINQLIAISHNILQLLEKGQDYCFISLDATADFDRVWHAGLIYKLKKIGICGTALDWLIDYLKDRKQRVVINGTNSCYIVINCGVPQGSILGPLLFLIYFNDITDNVKSDSFLYADDTSICRPITNPEIDFNILNKDLDNLSNWGSQWLVNFNPAKTKYIIFSKKHSNIGYPRLNLGNKELEKVKTLTHLGITFNSRMTWDSHIRNVIDRSLISLTHLKHINFKVPRLVKRQIYISYVRPLLEYGAELFDSCTIEQDHSLEVVQRQFCLIITGTYKATKYEMLLRECAIESLQSRRKTKKLVLMYKIVNALSPKYLQETLPRQSNVHYSFRNNRNIQQFLCKKDFFYESFFPSSIRLWNNLNFNLRDIQSLNEFKSKLNRKISKNFNKACMWHTANSAVQHSRMCMGLSALNSQRKAYNFISEDLCPNCHEKKETVTHFFFECPFYAAFRQEMLQNVEIIIQDYSSVETSDLVKLFLYGTGILK